VSSSLNLVWNLDSMGIIVTINNDKENNTFWWRNYNLYWSAMECKIFSVVNHTTISEKQ
jgi:hypothetical protein